MADDQTRRPSGWASSKTTWRCLGILGVLLAAGYALKPAPHKPAKTAKPMASVERPAVQTGRVGAALPRLLTPREKAPVADIPMLADETPEQRLQTLRWAQGAPGSKVVSLFPDLRSNPASYQQREVIARQRIAGEISRLEEEGVSAPESASSDLPIARIQETTFSPEILAAMAER